MVRCKPGLHGKVSNVKCCNDLVNRFDLVSLGVSKDEEMSCNELLQRMSEIFEVKHGKPSTFGGL